MRKLLLSLLLSLFLFTSAQNISHKYYTCNSATSIGEKFVPKTYVNMSVKCTSTSGNLNNVFISSSRLTSYIVIRELLKVEKVGENVYSTYSATEMKYGKSITFIICYKSNGDVSSFGLRNDTHFIIFFVEKVKETPV